MQIDKELVSLLAQLKLGDEIPEVLYTAVAEVLAVALWINKKWS